jgi:DnaA family protein
MEQLTFELAPPETPTFENFLPGRNAEAVHALRRVAAGDARETGLLLWGEPAAGRTHLLRAVVTEVRAHRQVLYLPQWQEIPAEPPGPRALVAADDVDGSDAAAQGRLFTLYNRLRETGGHLVAAAGVPPTRLRVREDLRTRLGWGLVYEVLPLTDAEKPAALAGYARERGFALPDEVIGHLLTYGRRDMRSLVATVAALDRFSLAHKRPITVPLLRAWLQRELAPPNAGE